MTNKILVLGGTGFIGKHVVNILQKNNHSVLAASRATGLDLHNYNNLHTYLAEHNPDVIFNCAAHVGSLHYVTTYAAQVIHDNMQMALNMYKAVAETCPKARVINPLSNCSYPGNLDVQSESDWWKGEVHESVFAYGNAKKFIYVLAQCYKKQHAITSINFLVPNTFGPGDSIDPNKTHALNGMIIRMIEAQKQGASEFEIWGTGNPIREWAYVDDVVNILMQGMYTQEDLTYPINLAQNKGFSIKQSAEFIAEALGFTGKLKFNTQYPDGAPVKILDNTNFKKLFPNFVFSDHKKGIAETVSYYKGRLKSL
jgi:GDP-L-fucose synthase